MSHQRAGEDNGEYCNVKVSHVRHELVSVLSIAEAPSLQPELQ